MEHERLKLLTSTDLKKCQKDLIEPILSFSDYREIEKMINGKLPLKVYFNLNLIIKKMRKRYVKTVKRKFTRITIIKDGKMKMESMCCYVRFVVKSFSMALLRLVLRKLIWILLKFRLILNIMSQNQLKVINCVIFSSNEIMSTTFYYT